MALGFWFGCPILLGSMIGVALAQLVKRARRRPVRYLAMVICALILLFAIPLPLVRMVVSFTDLKSNEVGFSGAVVLFGLSVLFAALTACAMLLSAFVIVRRSRTK